jgi:hypothetical protein
MKAVEQYEAVREKEKQQVGARGWELIVQQTTMYTFRSNGNGSPEGKGKQWVGARLDLM